MILKILVNFKLFPNIIFTFNPFKIYEFKQLIKGVKFSKNDKILDLGCGSGNQTLLLGRKSKSVVGIDILPSMIDTANTRSDYIKDVNSEFLCTDIKHASFKDQEFDKIFSFCVIEHISNYSEVLKELYRVLKDGGQLIFSVDALETIKENKLIEKHKKDHSVKRYFKGNELKRILNEIGFNKIDIYPIFKSNFAKNLFIKAINNKFQFGLLRSILSYFYLSYKERSSVNRNKGIFLIVKCYK